MQARDDVRFETRDPGEFETLIGDFSAGPISIGTLGASGFRGRARAWGLPRASLFLVVLKGARVIVPARPRVLCLTSALEGAFELAGGGEQDAFEAWASHVRDGSEGLDLVVPSSAMLVLNIDADLVEEQQRMLADAKVPRCGERISPATPEGARLSRRLASAWRDLRAHDKLLRSAAATTDFELGLAEAVAEAMLEAGADRAPDCGPDQLRSAEEFIITHLRDPISRADICVAVGVSERSLSRAFRRRHGVGPKTFLKQRRLDAAQRLLIAADPAERSVTDVAMECGLYHLGRFSLEYRHAFGESPSATLGC